MSPIKNCTFKFLSRIKLSTTSLVSKVGARNFNKTTNEQLVCRVAFLASRHFYSLQHSSLSFGVSKRSHSNKRPTHRVISECSRRTRTTNSGIQATNPNNWLQGATLEVRDRHLIDLNSRIMTEIEQASAVDPFENHLIIAMNACPLHDVSCSLLH